MNLLQSPTPTPPPPTTIPNLCATVLLGNAAALSLEWAECMRKIRFFELKSADLRIYFFSSHVRLLLEVGTLSIKCSETLHFSKERRGAYFFSI